MTDDKQSDLTSDVQRVSTYLRDRNKKDTVFAYASDGSRVPLRECRLINLYHAAGVWHIRDVINSQRQK